jgi:hypothetical protein
VVVIQPVSATKTFDVATSGIEVVNVTEYTGYFGEAYEIALEHGRPDYKNLATTGTIILAVYDVAMILIFIGLSFFRSEVISTISRRLRDIPYEGNNVPPAQHDRQTVPPTRPAPYKPPAVQHGLMYKRPKVHESDESEP